jgi:hypothetical protein
MKILVAALLASVLFIPAARAVEPATSKCPDYCKFQDEHFSVGVIICTGKHMKQTCTDQLKWEIVTEKDSDPAFCDGPLKPLKPQ